MTARAVTFRAPAFLQRDLAVVPARMGAYLYTSTLGRSR